MAGIARRVPHRLLIVLTMVLGLALAMPDAGDARHKRPKRRTGIAGLSSFVIPSTVFSCTWEEDLAHDYRCTGPGTLPFGLLVESEDAPGPRPPGALQKNGVPPNMNAEGWIGPPPLASPDVAPWFTCRQVAIPPDPNDASGWQCSFTYNAHTHLFPLSGVVSIAYSDAGDEDTTQQWFVPCDGSGPCPEKDPPPDTRVTTGPPDHVAARTATLRFTSSEAGSTFECRLDSLPFERCSASETYTGLGQGQRVFRVRATDDRGKTDQTPARHEWLIDLSGPRIAISPSPVRLTPRGVAKIASRCRGSELSGPCTGRLWLETAGRVPTRSGRRIVPLGSKRFRLTPGRRGTVRVRLPRPRRALIARLGSVRVRATADARDALGNDRTSNRRFTLRAP
jgi:hypothetical protein